MSEEVIKELMLESLYEYGEIQQVWKNNRNNSLIKHPQQGWISPNKYRSMYANKPCPYCAKKMVQGKDEYSTNNINIAKKRKYEYVNSQGILTINQAENTYYHPNYVTLDHKLNKTRFPELLFDFKNLEVICWRCNNEKKDNNSFEIINDKEYYNALYQSSKAKYHS